MKHLLWVVGVLALFPAVYFFHSYYKAGEKQGGNYGILSAVFFVVSIICWAVFFFIKFREEGEQDISITKF